MKTTRSKWRPSQILFVTALIVWAVFFCFLVGGTIGRTIFAIGTTSFLGLLVGLISLFRPWDWTFVERNRSAEEEETDNKTKNESKI